MTCHTRVIPLDCDAPDPAVLEDAAGVLRRGGLVAFATETVYGLGADATNPAAVARIFEAKGRPAINPLIVHADQVPRARECVASWPETARRLAERFWPGPLTLVLPRSSLIPDVVTACQETVGIRIPRTLVARRLIAALGRPVAAPSANRSTGISPTLAAHVLKDLEGRVDLILDSGQTTEGLESTVLDLTSQTPRLLRPGPITVAQIESALDGTAVVQAEVGEEQGPLPSPGLLRVHYAPTTRTVRVEGAEALADYPWPGRAVLVVFGSPAMPSLPAGMERFELPTPQSAAHDLYVVLHRCDALGVEQIVIVPPPDLPEWRAIRDRLWRASQRT